MMDYKFHEKLKQLSGYVYKNNKYTLPNDCIEISYKENKETGFYSSAFLINNQIVIVFRGTDKDNINDIKADLQMISNKIPNQIIDARNFYEDLKNTFPNKKIIFSGHSLGGSLAQIMSFETNCSAVTFSAYGTRKILATDKEPVNVINYGNKSDLIFMKNLDYQYGKTYVVDSNIPDTKNQFEVISTTKKYIPHKINHMLENIGDLNKSIEYKSNVKNNILKASIAFDIDYKNIDNKRVFTAEEIGNLSTDDFQKFEKYIDKQLKEFGVPREHQAKDMVSKRDLIWVDDYKRNDGTPVKGYYRRK